MAKAVVTLKIMPEDPEVDLAAVQQQAEALIDAFTGEPGEKRVEIKPIAFGLKAIQIMFVSDEKLGGTDVLEQQISGIAGVNSVEVVDVRRAIG